MNDTGSTGRAAVDLAEAQIVALEEACSRRPHRALLPYLGMARAELAQCRPVWPSRPVRLHEVSVASVPEGLAELESLLTRIVRSSTELHCTLRLVSARQLVREGIEAAV